MIRVLTRVVIRGSGIAGLGVCGTILTGAVSFPIFLFLSTFSSPFVCFLVLFLPKLQNLGDPAT